VEDRAKKGESGRSIKKGKGEKGRIIEILETILWQKIRESVIRPENFSTTSIHRRERRDWGVESWRTVHRLENHHERKRKDLEPKSVLPARARGEKKRSGKRKELVS